MDGGSGEAAGWFVHEAIEDELQQRVVAYNLPLRLCVRVVLITMLTLVWPSPAQSSRCQRHFEGSTASSRAATLAWRVDLVPWQPPCSGQA